MGKCQSPCQLAGCAGQSKPKWGTKNRCLDYQAYKPLYDEDFTQLANIALVFGSETAGLPEPIRAAIGQDNWLRLPMLPTSRSLNLSNSVAITLFEVWRQQGFGGDNGHSIGYDNLVPYDPK